MKHKIAFALFSTAVLGGVLSCFTNGQDINGVPAGPAGARRILDTSPLNIGSSDLAILNKLVAEEENTMQGVTTLLNKLRTVEGAEKESVVDKLKNAVGEQFDQRQNAKLKELKALEEQLARLKEIHNKRTQQREQIIGDRVQQLIREVDGLGWGTDVPDKSIFGRANADRGDLLPTGIARTLWSSQLTPPSPPSPLVKPSTLAPRATNPNRP